MNTEAYHMQGEYNISLHNLALGAESIKMAACIKLNMKTFYFLSIEGHRVKIPAASISCQFQELTPRHTSVTPTDPVCIFLTDVGIQLKTVYNTF